MPEDTTGTDGSRGDPTDEGGLEGDASGADASAASDGDASAAPDGDASASGGLLTPADILPADVALAEELTCAVTSAGGVACWGWNSAWRLGSFDALEIQRPVPVPDLPAGIVEVAAGNSFGCARTQGGAVYCWGADMGDYAPGGNTRAIEVSLGGPAQRIVAGKRHLCALLAGDATTVGKVVCFGDNDQSQLGRGATAVVTRQAPGQVVLPSAAVAIGAGVDHTCAGLADGKTYCWGRNTEGQLAVGDTSPRVLPTEVVFAQNVAPTSFVTFAGGYGFTCGLEPNGDVRCWGSGARLALGDERPGRVDTAIGTAQPGVAAARALAAGDAHACVVSAQNVSCWGRSSAGQLGLGTLLPNTTPTPVPGLPQPRSVHAGFLNTCARAESGALHCWGRNVWGSVGDGKGQNVIAPREVLGVGAVKAAAFTSRRGCIVRTDGTVACAGDGMSPTFTSVAGLAGATAVQAGKDFQCAVVAGEPLCWGTDNSSRKLGRNTGALETPLPLDPKLPAGTLHDLRLLEDTACAATSTGAYCWGADSVGGLDFAAGAYALVASGDVTTIGLGAEHHCWLSGGAVTCKGNNSAGELGKGDVTASTSPVTPTGLGAGVTALGVGEEHSCALASGAVKCWGRNLSGQVTGATGVATRMHAKLAAGPRGGRRPAGERHPDRRRHRAELCHHGRRAPLRLGRELLEPLGLGERKYVTSPTPVIGF